MSLLPRTAPVSRRISSHRVQRSSRRRPLVILAALGVLLTIAGGASAVLAATVPAPAPAPAADNPNCTLQVPAQPLTAAGLATPYQLVATDRGKGACHESNSAQSAFVEAAVLDPATGAVSVYHPLVTDAGQRPAVPPVTPVLPAGAVVGIWFGSNGDTLTLRGQTAAALGDGHCVNGLRGSMFGQFAYCGAVEFFRAANAAIAAGKLTVPAAQTGRDGLPCPTVRDFAVVDQDQSDNVVSTYLVLDNGRMAQNTGDNQRTLGTSATRLTNGSDNGLVDRFVSPALGCTPWTAPDLGDPGASVPALALNELFAAARTRAPVALVPTNDPMTEVGGTVSVAKTNLYRAGVDQPALASATGVGTSYCRNLVTVAPNRLIRDRQLFRQAPSPDPAAAPTLFGFLAQRLRASYDLLGCSTLLHRRNPINLTVDNRGAAVDATTVAPDAPAPPSPAPSVSAQHN
jgi:hypothetical protein